MNQTIELAIIGAGVAGVSAAVYAHRAGLQFSLLEPHAIGGQLLLMERVDNYPGLGVGTQARVLAENLEKTLSILHIEPIQEAVTSAAIEKNQLRINTDERCIVAKSAIVATGASFKKLAVEGEEDFSGRGVSYCAICDGFFFKNKVVAVVGGGNSAVEEALYLSNICKKVYLIHRRDNLRAIAYLQKEVSGKSNIEIIFNTVVRRIQGKDFVETLILEDVKTHAPREFAVNGLFVAIGVTPATEILRGIVTMDEAGFIITNEEMNSSVPFIWACGDCRNRPLRQLITAASEGATAAISAYKYLKGGYISA
ncbi:MAG: FAD-dependent oxidoreductase [Candidatus Omnitrophota bacterium]